MELGGVVFIDRADGKSAINAMQPLVDAMRKHGKSVVLAPEGTRTVSPDDGAVQERRLSPGHAGRRADRADRDTQLGRCRAQGRLRIPPRHRRCEVLPPVDTSEWRVET